MLETFATHIGQHWFLSTYLSVMVLNESAMLTAFALASDQGAMRIAGVAFAATAGSFTNDIILYLIARYGFSRFFIRTETETSEVGGAILDRIFLKNAFLSLLFIKFLFGVRLILTIYLVAKKQIPLKSFVFYDAVGVLLYVSIVGGIGILIGSGNSAVEDRYSLIVRTITFVTLSVLVLRLLGSIFEQGLRHLSTNQNKN